MRGTAPRLLLLAASVAARTMPQLRKEPPPPPPPQDPWVGSENVYYFAGVGILAVLAFLLHLSQRARREDVFKQVFADIAREHYYDIEDTTSIDIQPFIYRLQHSYPRQLRLLSVLEGNPKIADRDEAAMKSLANSIDADRDGKIVWKEWRDYVADQRSKVAKKVFDEIDAGSDGRKLLKWVPKIGVEAKELAGALKAKPHVLELFNLNGCEPDELLTALDENGDGFVSWEEFEEMVVRVEMLVKARHVESAKSDARKKAKAN